MIPILKVFYNDFTQIPTVTLLLIVWAVHSKDSLQNLKSKI